MTSLLQNMPPCCSFLGSFLRHRVPWHLIVLGVTLCATVYVILTVRELKRIDAKVDAALVEFHKIKDGFVAFETQHAVNGVANGGHADACAVGKDICMAAAQDALLNGGGNLHGDNHIFLSDLESIIPNMMFQSMKANTNKKNAGVHIIMEDDDDGVEEGDGEYEDDDYEEEGDEEAEEDDEEEDEEEEEEEEQEEQEEDEDEDDEEGEEEGEENDGDGEDIDGNVNDVGKDAEKEAGGAIICHDTKDDGSNKGDDTQDEVRDLLMAKIDEIDKLNAVCLSPPGDDYASMKVDTLRRILKEHGMDWRGNKETLVQRLLKDPPTTT